MSDKRPRLYHAPSSYYSMIARLALAEGGIAYESVSLDIHFRMEQQELAYARLNPQMTVPTLVLADRILDQSRAIAGFALGVDEAVLDTETRTWLDLHYAFPIEELTFGGLLASNPIARFLIPRRLRAVSHRLEKLAATNPDLADIYTARAKIFAERARIFDPMTIAQLAARRRDEAASLLDRLEQTLKDGRAVIVPPAYGIADVVWTVFLARMEFAGLGTAITERPALACYWQTMQARPSFAAADLWTKLHPLRLLSGLFNASACSTNPLPAGLP